MLRVVLDTNVLVSALLFHGTPGQVVELAIEGEVQAMTSPALLEELQRVLISKFGYPADVADFAATEWKNAALLVEPTEQIHAIPQDPSDNRVLECALSARADAIISVDKHLLALKSYRHIPILTPQAFLDTRHKSGGQAWRKPKR